MEGLIIEAGRLLLTQGIGWVVAVLSVGGLIWLYLKTNTDREKAEGIRSELQEKRIVEARETVKVLHVGTEANVRMASALEEQAHSGQALLQLMTQMERDMDRNNEAWKPQVASMVAALASNHTMLATINAKLDQLLGRRE